jgi:cyclohexadienyl dehydratase
MNRRHLATTGALAAGALLAATRAEAQSVGKSRLAQVLERGTLKVGTTGDFNPMSFRDTASNELRGFDIEAMQGMAADLGVKIVWVQAVWATLVAGVASNRFDIFSGASVSIARARTAAFSMPYLEAGTVPVTTKANAPKFTTWESLNAPGVRISVSQGTVFDEQARKYLPKSEIRSVQAPATGYQEVLSGRADATITSNVEASTLVQRFPALTLLGSGAELRSRRPFAYVVAQDDPTWLNFINTWITLKTSEGLFASLEAKWLPKG